MPSQHRRADAFGEAADSHGAVGARAPKSVVVLVGPDMVSAQEFLTAAVEVLTEQGDGGGSLGFPLMHVKITVLGGEVHETGSTELAFRYAAGDAFEKGLARRALCCWSRSCGSK